MISIGIDVSKGKSTVCFLKPGGEVLKTPFEVSHTKNELNELADQIISYGEEARVVLETQAITIGKWLKLSLSAASSLPLLILCK